MLVMLSLQEWMNFALSTLPAHLFGSHRKHSRQIAEVLLRWQVCKDGNRHGGNAQCDL